MKGFVYQRLGIAKQKQAWPIARRYQHKYRGRMVGRAILKLARGLCLICFCILGIALVVAFAELVTAPILLKATGCSPTEILPGFNCGNGWVDHLIEIVLDLPFLFVLAVVFSVFPTNSPPSREFMFILYFFDVVLILALTYLVLRLLERKRARRNQ